MSGDQPRGQQGNPGPGGKACRDQMGQVLLGLSRLLVDRFSNYANGEAVTANIAADSRRI